MVFIPLTSRLDRLPFSLNLFMIEKDLLLSLHHLVVVVELLHFCYILKCAGSLVVEALHVLLGLLLLIDGALHVPASLFD